MVQPAIGLRATDVPDHDHGARAEIEEREADIPGTDVEDAFHGATLADQRANAGVLAHRMEPCADDPPMTAARLPELLNLRGVEPQPVIDAMFRTTDGLPRIGAEGVAAEVWTTDDGEVLADGLEDAAEALPAPL